VDNHRLCRELPLDVLISGSFPEIYNFVVRLENGNRLARIEKLTVQRKEAQNVCEARMQLALFFALDKTG